MNKVVRRMEVHILYTNIHTCTFSHVLHVYTHPHAHTLFRFLQLDVEDLLPFVTVFKHIPLKRQTIITCMTTLKKSHDEPDAVSCIVAGTENKDIYILDPEAFTVLKKVNFYIGI